MSTDSNLSRARRYLELLGRDVTDPELATVFHPEYTFYEKPNRLNPKGRVMKAAELSALTAKAKQIILEQRYVIRSELAAGDEVALEVDWVGRFNVAFASTPAGEPIRATCGMFLTFRDGKLYSQRNYDCYDAF